MAEAEKYNSIYTGQQIDNAVGAGLAVRGVNGLVKSNGNGTISPAVAEEDYAAPFSYDALHGYTGVSETKNRVTFTWDGESCTVSTGGSTASAQTVSNLYYDMNNLMPGLMRGKTYRIRYSSTAVTTQVSLKIWFYKNGTYYSGYSITADRDDIVILSAPDINGMLIRLQVESGKTVNETISLKLLGPYPNKSIDTEPVSDSDNLITSGAVYDAILGAIGGSY